MKLIFTLSIAIFGAGAGALEKIQVGSSPVMSSVGLYLADGLGFFKAQGLNVEIVDVANSGAPMTGLLAAGKLDVGAGNLTAGLFSALAQGEQVKLVADKGHIQKDRDYIALIVRQDHVASGRFRQLKDLKGFKLGLTALDGVSQQILLEKFLKKAGLTSKDVECIKLSYAEMNVALKTKSLDAAIQLEPFVAQAEAEGFAKRIAGGAEVYPGQQSAAILYSGGFIKQRREEALKFMRAYLQGVEAYNKSLHDDKLREAVLKVLAGRLKFNAKLWDKMVPVGLDPEGKLNAAALQEDLDWYLSRGYLKTRLKATDIVDGSFAHAASQSLNAK